MFLNYNSLYHPENYLIIDFNKFYIEWINFFKNYVKKIKFEKFSSNCDPILKKLNDIELYEINFKFLKVLKKFNYNILFENVYDILNDINLFEINENNNFYKIINVPLNFQGI
jgi:hypothetical protein